LPQAPPISSDFTERWHVIDYQQHNSSQYWFQNLLNHSLVLRAIRAVVSIYPFSSNFVTAWRKFFPRPSRQSLQI